MRHGDRKCALDSRQNLAKDLETRENILDDFRDMEEWKQGTGERWGWKGFNHRKPWKRSIQHLHLLRTMGSYGRPMGWKVLESDLHDRTHVKRWQEGESTSGAKLGAERPTETSG